MNRYFRTAIFMVIISLIVFILTLYMIRILNDPKMKSTTCLEKYTHDELAFFAEVGFLFNEKVWKWEESIKVSIAGQPIGDDAVLIDSILEELKPLIYPVKIIRSKEPGNLIVEFKEDPIDHQVMGFTNYGGTHFTSSKIYSAKIEIFSKSKGQCRQACIRHEFLHALGLNHPKRRNTGTIIESLVEYMDADMGNVKLFKYSALDKSVLSLLYSDCIPIGLKKQTFIKPLIFNNITNYTFHAKTN